MTFITQLPAEWSPGVTPSILCACQARTQQNKPGTAPRVSFELLLLLRSSCLDNPRHLHRLTHVRQALFFSTVIFMSLYHRSVLLGPMGSETQVFQD